MTLLENILKQNTELNCVVDRVTDENGVLTFDSAHNSYGHLMSGDLYLDVYTSYEEHTPTVHREHWYNVHSVTLSDTTLSFTYGSYGVDGSNPSLRREYSLEELRQARVDFPTRTMADLCDLTTDDSDWDELQSEYFMSSVTLYSNTLSEEGN